MLVKIFLDESPNDLFPSIKMNYYEDQFEDIECYEYTSRTARHYHYCYKYNHKTKEKQKVEGPFRISRKILQLTPTTSTGKEGKNSVEFDDPMRFADWIEKMTDEFVSKLRTDRNIICKFDENGSECYLEEPIDIIITTKIIAKQENLYIYKAEFEKGLNIFLQLFELSRVIPISNHILLFANKREYHHLVPRRARGHLIEGAIFRPVGEFVILHPEHGKMTVTPPSHKDILLALHFHNLSQPE